MVEDETEVVAGAAQQGVDGAADGAGKEVTIEPAVVLHVTDHGFDGAAPSELASHRWRQATALACDEDAAVGDTMATIAAIDVGADNGGARQPLDLVEGGLEGVAGSPRMPSTSPSRLVAATETVTPNS